MKIDYIKIPALIAVGVAVGILCTLGLMSSKSDDTTQNNTTITEFPQSPTSSQPYIPQEIIFCGERVPLELFDVYESLDYEMIVNMYRHSATISYLKKAKRYFPEIEKVLKENNIPDDLKYLCVAESGMSNVVSPAGATGFWQFMKAAGTEYGLRIDSNVDERYNHHKSVVAACKYFKDAYRNFGSWTLVAASYNMGMGGLRKSIDAQKADNYWDLLLNQETARYVYRIIALKLVMENPTAYGFNLDEKDLYSEIETYTITVDSTINDLTQFAFDNGTNIKMLKYFNPWLRTNVLPNQSGKEYQIELPKKGLRTCKIPENQ